MPEFHAEPYIYLPAVSHKSALVAWGAFYFRVKSDGEAKLVKPEDLDNIHPPRKDSIGVQSATYGPATVEVFDATGRIVASASTTTANHCWVTGLEADTEYTYRVTVKGEEWAEGERWNWSAEKQGLVQGGRYDNRFRTNPDPTRAVADLTFGVLGDFGVGVRKAKADRFQQQIGDALKVAADTRRIRFILTTGDNVYASKKFLGIPVGGSGDVDEDWFFTYFQPYRYVINRIPVYPSVGNHDTGESEHDDDRAQVEDNFYVRERIASEQSAGRASFGPGMFYRFRYGSTLEFICIDTSKENVFAKRLFEHPNHGDFLEQAFPAVRDGIARFPFCHHPPFCAGPRHFNTESMIEKLVPLFRRAGVKAMFTGHEHQFQHSIADSIHYFVSGASGKVAGDRPSKFAEAHTQSWSGTAHFLLVEVAAGRMSVRAIGKLAAGAQLVDINRQDPAGAAMSGAVEFTI